MENFVVYLESTGEIVRSGMCAEVQLQTHHAGERAMVTESLVDGANHYVQAGSIVERPEMALGYSEGAVQAGAAVAFTSVPAGSVVRFAGERVVVDDGVLEWSSAEPGRYELRFSCFPYRDAVISVEVV